MFEGINKTCINIYRLVAVVLLFVFCFFGLFAGIGDCTAEYIDIGLGGDDDGILDFISWVFLGSSIGFVQFLQSILFIQFLDNVQVIREKVEKM